MSSLSRRSAQTLMDLVENKLSCLMVYDREDARELAILEQARRELAASAGMDPRKLPSFASTARERRVAVPA
jgi:hypothetical protein